MVMTMMTAAAVLDDAKRKKKEEAEEAATAAVAAGRPKSRKNLQGKIFGKEETPSPKVCLGTSWRGFQPREW